MNDAPGERDGVGGSRILVVGAGFAGLYAAMELRAASQAGHRVTVVNEENFMQYQPFLPEVASGTIDPRAVVVPLRRVLRHCEVLIGDVRAIEHERRRATVRFIDGREEPIGYDVLVLTAGSTSRVLPVPGLAEHGVGFKTVQEAIFLRNHVLSELDVAAETPDAERRRAALTFVFVGAGYAGVEAIGELEDLAREAIGTYPMLRADEMRWILMEAMDRILPELSEDLARYAMERLRERGIEIALHTRLDSAEEGVMRLSDGRAFPAETLVWTAGVKPSPLARRSDLPVDDTGRVLVDETLHVRGVENAWAAGDAASVPDRTTGRAAPPTAQHALREGRRLGKNVVAVLEGRRPEPFVYRNIGGVASLGRYKGVAMVYGVKFRGSAAWAMHRSYHLAAMPTLSRKVKIAMDWTTALLFPRDIAQLGALERPRQPFRRAAGE